MPDKRSENTDNPVYAVIRHIKDLLNRGVLNFGDKLPPERKLAEEISVSRAHVRSALNKLELYGIIKKYPQSGSVISNLNIQAIDGLIADVLKIENYDFHSLVETRITIELEAIRLCALRHTAQHMADIESALKDFIVHFNDDQRVEKDFIFHRSLVKGCNNPVLSSMFLIITPDIMHYYNQHRICNDLNMLVIQEHIEIIEAVRERNPDKAVAIMKKHLSNLCEFSENHKEAYTLCPKL